MKLRTMLAGSAIATLALVAGAGLPPGLSHVTQAEAAVNISVSFFYDSLASHGDWVRYHDAYVFIPAGVDANWRPYTEGHWVHTKRYGWTWVSDEPFGWATYHYGRWGHAEDIGWYWVPGTRWAPAWVSWRRSADYIVWAPLPPAHGDADVSISISVGDIPDYYWVAVPAREFLSPDIHVVVIREDREVRDVITRTEFIGAPRITNNIVVNNVIDVDVVAKATGQKVKNVEVRETDDPAKVGAGTGEVIVLKGDVATDEAAKPKKLRDISEVKKAKGEDTGTAAETQPVPAPNKTKGTAKLPEDQTGAPAAKSAEQPATDELLPKKKVKKQAGEQPAEETTGTATAPEVPDADQPDTKKVKKQAGEQPVEPADEATGTTAPLAPEKPDKADDQGKAKPGKQKKGQDDGKKACDPEVDPNCQPAE